MKAYNSKTLFNGSLRKKVRLWYAKKLLSEKQYLAILNNNPVTFYTPNVFVKIGLFIFTAFILFAVLGIYCLLFSSLFNSNNASFVIFTCLFFATACFVSLELLIEKRNLYNSGIDEALLYFGLIFLSAALYQLTDNLLYDSPLFLSLIALPFICFAVIRYADKLTTLALCLCLYAIVFLLIMKLGEVAKMIMPFAMMIFSGIFYIQIKKLKNQENLFYWKSCFAISEFISLIILYIACNYYVIRESGISFFNLQLANGQDIPLAFLFYVLTATVPMAYIYFGLKRKDKTLLWSGLVLLAVSVITFKYYFSLGHPEISLTVAGIVLIVVAYFSINYFKKPKYGITYEEEIDEDSFLKSNAEALVIVQSLSSQTESPESQDYIQFGGGQSGGAGSGGTY
jgi:hypothetical protein